MPDHHCGTAGSIEEDEEWENVARFTKNAEGSHEPGPDLCILDPDMFGINLELADKLQGHAGSGYLTRHL